MDFFDPSRLLTTSLHRLPWGESAARIMAIALDAVEPGNAVWNAISRKSNRLRISNKQIDLRSFRNVYLVGAGKAGSPMARSTGEILATDLTGGIVIVKEGYAGQPNPGSRIIIREAGHPLPDQRGLQATVEIITLLKEVSEQDLVICLISGGGSALLTSPVEGVSLADLQALTTLLLHRGATIHEINTLRKHLDRVKGGGLARLANGATIISLILSDVVGDPLDIIASGPTVADPSTFFDAYEVLKQYHLIEDAPTSIVSHIRLGCARKIPETPKTDDPCFLKVTNLIIGSNYQAAQAALKQAKLEGFRSLILTTHLQGEARQAGRVLASIAHTVRRHGQPIQPPACLIAGGETTVTVTGDGLGGRNQELVLGAIADLAGLEDVALISLATDGGDGPTDAAGAVATGETFERARELGLAPKKFLNENDSYHFFAPLGDLLQPGPTLTNVNDLCFLFIG